MAACPSRTVNGPKIVEHVGVNLQTLTWPGMDMPNPYAIGFRHQSTADFTVFCTVNELLGQVQFHYSTSAQKTTRLANLIGMAGLEHIIFECAPISPATAIAGQDAPFKARGISWRPAVTLPTHTKR